MAIFVGIAARDPPICCRWHTIRYNEATMTTSSKWRSLLTEIERTRTANGRFTTHCYSLEGLRLLERALRAHAPLQGVVVSATFAASQQPRHRRLLADLAAAGYTPEVAPDTAVAAITQGRGLGDVLALVRMPPASTLADTLAATSPTPPLLLVAADIIDPGNVGALVRTGHASGITAFVALGRSDPFHPKAVRTSMGSLFKTTIVTEDSSDNLLTTCRQHAITTIGTVAAGTGTLLPQAALTGGTAVFMGNEYRGLSPAITTQLDQTITIPMADGIDSYSVNAAAAVILYEATRQRMAALSDMN